MSMTHAHRFVLTALLCAGGCLLGPAPARAGEWSAAEAERVIAFGFTAVVERHLQPVTAATIALDGMRGLADLDPQMGVVLKDGSVRLSTAEAVVRDFPAPAETDVAGWAHLAVAAVDEARKVSEPLRRADDETLYQAVFEGALGKADVYSRYSSAREAREQRASRNGFGGIGIKFDLVDGEPRVLEVVEDTPAHRAGMRAGDVIVAIDGQSVRGLDRNGISGLLRGAVGSDLVVQLRRSGDGLTLALRRSRIVPKSVTMTLTGGIARFRITSFNQGTAHSLEAQLQDARSRLGAGLQGVILDLRGNPGGLLDKAVAVVDLFVDKGPIVFTKGRHPEAGHSFEAHPGDVGEDLAVVVLVDGRSASAAEIVASALQDAGRAVVIGTNSYGKGTVQTVITLPNDGEITLTWSRFHSPSGYALHGLGVLPALCTAANPPPAATVDEAARGKGALARLPETLAVWRHAGFEETALRQRLRDGCPPSRRSDQRLDMELAERLLSYRAAFARALSQSGPGRVLETSQRRGGETETGPH